MAGRGEEKGREELLALNVGKRYFINPREPPEISTQLSLQITERKTKIRIE